MGPQDLSQAIALATWAHTGQYDKAGEPYILHPLRVMFKMVSYEERIVAVCHDTIEDTELKLEDFITWGFPPEITEALDALTHREGEDYPTYIQRIKASSPLAVRVKLADLSDNMNRNRIPFPSERDEKRWRKYEAAYLVLSS